MVLSVPHQLGSTTYTQEIGVKNGYESATIEIEISNLSLMRW
jgi:hypothetical protein